MTDSATVAADTSVLASTPPSIPTGVFELNGKSYMTDDRGAHVPVSQIKAQELLQDETVRRIFHYGEPLSAQIGRFVQHTFDDVDSFKAILDQEYGVPRGGKKGNLTLTSFDGLRKVEVAKADLIDFGPSLNQAKALVDACVADWSSEAGEQLQALVTRAFNVENGGLANRGALLSLLRFEITDDRWKRAMDAVRDAIKVRETKRYIRLYKRDSTDDAWTPVPINAARA